MLVLSRKNKIIPLFLALSNQNKVEQIASLLMIINQINASKTSPLSSFVYRKSFTDDEGKRMGKVYDYAMEHYQESITLDEIAEKANMSKNAFCRYFKKRTNKTFFQFLIEIRIENACKLLLKNPELSIALLDFFPIFFWGQTEKVVVFLELFLGLIRSDDGWVESESM